MKKKLVLISILALCAVTTFTARGAFTEALQKKYGGQLDMTKFHRGHAIDDRLQRQRQAFPGGGFIDPEQNLSRTDKEDLAYYRRWKQAV